MVITMLHLLASDLSPLDHTQAVNKIGEKAKSTLDLLLAFSAHLNASDSMKFVAVPNAVEQRCLGLLSSLKYPQSLVRQDHNCCLSSVQRA